MAKKPSVHSEYMEIVYGVERWRLLEDLRKKALQLMEGLEEAYLETVVHGSIARGDVNSKSDIDIFVLNAQSSFTVETMMEKIGIPANRRLIVQATPTYAMKAHIEIDENMGVSFPLMNMRKVEREFYRFGGQATVKDLRSNIRVVGVDKRLVLIQPTEYGHGESSIVGREEHVAKLLGISAETVLDRVHALLRRDHVGRTGVFIKKELAEDETFEIVLKRFADQNPAVRRRLASLP